MRICGPVLALLLAAGTARADIVLEDPCAGKFASDPCRTAIDQLPGTCTPIPGPEGRPAEAMRCMTEGELKAPRPDPEQSKPLKPAEPPQAGWCSVAGGAPPSLLLALLLLRRRRPKGLARLRPSGLSRRRQRDE